MKPTKHESADSALPSAACSAFVKIEEADELLMLIEDTIKGKDGDTITRIRGLLHDASLLLQNAERSNA